MTKKQRSLQKAAILIIVLVIATGLFLGTTPVGRGAATGLGTVVSRGLKSVFGGTPRKAKLTQAQRDSIDAARGIADSIAAYQDSLVRDSLMRDSVRRAEEELERLRQEEARQNRAAATARKTEESKQYASTGHHVPIDSVKHRGSLSFTTKGVRRTQQGFEITFSVTNPETESILTISDVVPRVIFRHYYQPEELLDTTDTGSLHEKIARATEGKNRKPFTVPGKPVLGASVVDRISFELKPGQTRTFTVELIPNHEVPAVLATGFMARYTDKKGARTYGVSDHIYIVDVQENVRFAKLNLMQLIERTKKRGSYDFTKDVSLTMNREGEKPAMGPVESPWRILFRGSLDFLRDWDK